MASGRHERAAGPPLGGRYALAVAIVVLGLCPGIVLTTTSTTLVPLLQHDLHASRQGLQLTEGMADAGYALGAVFAAHLAQGRLQRRMFLCYEALFVVGAVLAASAPVLAVYAAGRVLEGVASGLLLVAALPPLVTRHGSARLPLTFGIVNVALFGASAVGPLLGGLAASEGHWRPLVAALAVLGAAGALVAHLGYDRFDPPRPGAPVDRPALALVVPAALLPFFATSVLQGRSLAAPLVLVPFAAGMLALVALVVVEARSDDPLMPVRALATQLPVTGTVVAMVGGAVFVTALQLVQLLLVQGQSRSPLATARLLLPLPLGAVAAAVLFALLFRTRWVPLVADLGLACLAAGCGLLLLADRQSSDWVVPVASGVLGLGAGATVSPGLLLAGLGVPSPQLGRAFALVQLLRLEAAYAVSPVVVALAGSSRDIAGGVRAGLVAMLALAVVGLLAALVLPAVSGARLRPPDLDRWLEGGTALPSPPTAVHLRPGTDDEAAAPLLGGPA
ncbi:MFS transporter [Motilibacter rhizosphaerae]|uniref:MFS transporter n=1 Tax=Motilibacter rhizosphaerae TaxID=598652 RepID=A0A4Q7NGG1_9ACTN|nr:MFS transporter [Motilibacter rhizosphaerae]RZS82899.1 MFS transporter [Motilibacter rhizosphaerae]